MAQKNIFMDDETRKILKEQAKKNALSESAYIRTLIRRDAAAQPSAKPRG